MYLEATDKRVTATLTLSRAIVCPILLDGAVHARQEQLSQAWDTC